MQTPDAYNARRNRTHYLMTERAAFLEQMESEVRAHARAAARKGMVAAVRPNGSSDIAWERVAPALFDIPGVAWYDYTKDRARMEEYLAGRLPASYHLTFSRDERPESDAYAVSVLARGGNVAVVFDRLPATWHGFPVIDGDVHDARFQDEPRSVVGLSAKGAARGDSSGFVVRI